ncbi:MAG: hypothetical protein WBL75_10415 [Candidatus Acidiferrum sp.]
MLSLLDSFAAIASIVGLVLSVLAWRRANDAKRAATDARRAVRESSAVEEQRRLAVVANELLIEIQSSQWRTARMRCADLIVGVSFAKRRWQALATVEVSEALDSALGSLNKLSRSISGEPVDIPDPARPKILAACHDIVVKLAEAAGRMQQAMEAKQDG